MNLTWQNHMWNMWRPVKTSRDQPCHPPVHLAHPHRYPHTFSSSALTAASLTAHHLACPTCLPPSRDICMHACIHERVLNLNIFFTVNSHWYTANAGHEEERMRERQGGRKGDTRCTLYELKLNHTQASYTSALPCLSFYYLLIFSF